MFARFSRPLRGNFVQRPMRLRSLLAAVFVQRLQHRAAWRRSRRQLRTYTVEDVVRVARYRGLAPQDGLQEWLIAKCALDACRPRRPDMLHSDASSSTYSDTDVS